MTQITLTFSIAKYLPSDFNFSSFSFIISSESRDFEQEISYKTKNQIFHKFNLPKKDAKYSIKVTKNNSLIGISDISIPSNIFQKKEKNFTKICNINMTDSVKRVLFKNATSDLNLKIEINCALQYKEKEKEKDMKLNHSTSTNKKINNVKSLKDMKTSGTFSYKNILSNKKSGIITNNNSNIKKQYSNSKSNKNIKSPKIMKPKTSMFNYGNNEENKLNENKKEKKEVKDIIKKKEIQKEKNEIKDNKEKEILKDKEKEKEKENESILDEELNKEIKGKDDEFYNFMNDFKERHPLEKLESMNDVNELRNHTKNIIMELLEYQIKFYSQAKTNFATKKKFKNLMLQYNEKFRNTKKEINRTDEMIDLCEIKSEFLGENKSNSINNLLSLKENEIDNYNNICNDYIEKNKENKKEEKKEDNTQLIEKGKNVLIKVLQQFFEKKGPINKIYTLSNSTEPERVNIIKLAEKYNFPLNSEIKEEDEIPGPEKDEDDEKDEKIKSQEENIDNDTLKEKEENIEDNNTNNIDKGIEKEEQDESKEKNIFDQKITKWEYVSTEKPDKIDKKLELYLKYFYSKRTFPVVIFKKTSTNNYEYGKQKVMIKIEGDTIRVRHLGSYLILDKFIELNAATEEKKLKKNNEKNTNADSKTNKKKEIIQKKKK